MALALPISGCQPGSLPPAVTKPTRSLSQLALVFALLFATLVLASLFPFTPLDPLWQLRVSGTLQRSSSLALISVALVELTTFLDPEDPVLEDRQHAFSRIALFACVGFLLLIPLQIHAGFSQYRNLNASETQRLVQSQNKLISLRQAVEAATSYDNLRGMFQQLQGPTLGPPLPGDSLTQIKAQVNAALDQSQAKITRKRASIASSTPVRLIPPLLRDSVSCLILAFGFALFSRMGGSDVNLIEEINLRLQQRSLEKKRAIAETEEEELLRQIEEEDREEANRIS